MTVTQKNIQNNPSMSIVRTNKKENPFAQIDRKLLEDDRLSWKAKGILCYLLSKPDKWEVSVADIEKKSDDGVDAIRAGLSELARNGYAELLSLRDEETGQMLGKTWVVSEEPSHRRRENPDVGKTRKSGNPKIGKSDPSNNEEVSNNETRSNNPLTPTSGGTDTQPESPPTKKAKASKKAGAACAAATEADFSNFANPELALSIWSTWVDYKRQQKNFTYKSDVAQAAAITKLFNCSGGSIQKARAVIEDSMANGYSGFFPYKDDMAASVRPDQIAAPIIEDTFHLEPDMLERYTSTTKWFYTKCPACTGIRWLSKKEFLSVMQRSHDLIAEMWYTKCPEEDFNGHVTKSIVSLNAAPRWEKEKWPSIFEWLRHDLKIRIFGKKDNQ